MKDITYCVRKGRVIHAPTNGNIHETVEIWAKEGDYLVANHPRMHEWLEGQKHKMKAVSRLPKGSVIVDVPLAALRWISRDDRKNRANKQSPTANVAIDGKVEAMQEQLDIMASRIETLESENKSLLEARSVAKEKVS